MKKAEIEKRMAEIAKATGEIYDELDAIDAEETPEFGTPQSHIRRLKKEIKALKKEYHELWKKLDTAA